MADWRAYFPKELLDGELARHGKWYGEALAALQEPPLFGVFGPEQAAYRFLWLRTFGRPVAIRAEQAEGLSMVTVREGGWNEVDGHDLVTDRARELSQGEWAAIEAHAAQAAFWDLPSLELLDSDMERGRDGAIWLVEGNNGSAYHLVKRDSPGPSPFRSLCLHMLALSGLRLGAHEIY